MSAVAAAQNAAAGSSAPHVANGTDASLAKAQELESYRWMLWFGTPVLLAAFFAGLSFATGEMGWIAGSVCAILGAIGTLIYLCLSTCTNVAAGSPASH